MLLLTDIGSLTLLFFTSLLKSDILLLKIIVMEDIQHVPFMGKNIPE